MDQRKQSIMPLYYFFRSLRQHGFELGLGDYELFLNTLHLKYGLGLMGYTTLLNELHLDKMLVTDLQYLEHELLQLIKLLWLKPGQDEQRFKELFLASFKLDFGTFKPIEERSLNHEQTAKTKDADTATKGLSNEKLPKYHPNTTNLEPAAVTMEEDKINVKFDFSKGYVSPQAQMARAENTSAERSRFLFSQNYFPVDRRKLKQNFRTFLQYKRGHSTNEIDIDATVKLITENGIFNELVWKRNKSNIIHLLLLIDKSDSMVAFSQVVSLLQGDLESVLKPIAGKLQPLQAFCFYNPADEYFFKVDADAAPVSINKTLNELKGKQIVVFILSDVGAAGGYQAGKKEAAANLLKNLHTYTQKVAWLNPMPSSRWQTFLSQEINDELPMFEANETGIKHAIDYFKRSNG